MATKKWVVDPNHSEIHFKIKHLMITNVTGSFNHFTGEATSNDNDFTNAAISFTVDVASLDTGNEQRDGHVKSTDFFDAEKFPQITFTSTAFAGTNLIGNLTIKNITHAVTLDAEFGGIVNDMYGNTKAGFTITGKINRKDFGLNWNAAIETGGVVLGEEVKINCEIQLTEQK